MCIVSPPSLARFTPCPRASRWHSSQERTNSPPASTPQVIPYLAPYLTPHLTPSDTDTAEEFVNKEVNFKAMCRTLTDPRYHERMQL
jgi:hypothetical protein